MAHDHGITCRFVATSQFVRLLTRRDHKALSCAWEVPAMAELLNAPTNPANLTFVVTSLWCIAMCFAVWEIIAIRRQAPVAVRPIAAPPADVWRRPSFIEAHGRRDLSR
jgi:hypothetical protein